MIVYWFMFEICRRIRLWLTGEAVDRHSAGMVEAFLAVALVFIQHKAVTSQRQTLDRKHEKTRRSDSGSSLHSSLSFSIPEHLHHVRSGEHKQ